MSISSTLRVFDGLRVRAINVVCVDLQRIIRTRLILHACLSNTD